MIRVISIALAGALAALSFGAGSPAVSGEKGASAGSAHPKSGYYRNRGKRPQVRGYSARRGGYSYSYTDTINTYGDSRSVYGATQSFRDPMLDRQTNAGPFDHGFFFESGVAPRGGNSPYMN